MTSLRAVRKRHIELFNKYGDLITLKMLPEYGKHEIEKAIKTQVRDIVFLIDPRNRPLHDTDLNILYKYLKIYKEIQAKFNVKIKRGVLAAVFG